MKKEILHPCLIKCALLSHDLLWKNVFENLAYGRCPSGLYINKNYIQCAIKGKEVSYKIDNRKPVQDLRKEITDILSTFVSDECKLSTGHGHTAWNQVKRKVIRDTLLERYVLDRTKSFKLSIHVDKRLLSALIISLMFKTISSKNIEYRDGYIHHIDGFCYEPKRVLITKNIYYSKVRDDTTIDTFPTNRYLSESWNIYLAELRLK
jgi:hypothetical protein